MFRYPVFQCLVRPILTRHGSSSRSKDLKIRLIEALRDGCYDVEEKGGLTKYTLKDDIPWLYQKKCGEPLIVRKSTKDIFQKVEEHGGDVLITGNPGIGKTWMHNYFLLRWIPQMDAHDVLVLHQVHKKGEMVVVKKRGRSIISSNRKALQFRHFFNVTYLADTGGPDSNEPYGDYMRTILTSSPARRHYKSFVTESKPLRLYYNTWSLEELLAAMPANMNAELVRERFALVGGIPRYVFANDQDFTDYMNRMKDAIITLDWANPERWRMGDQLSNSHRIFAIEPSQGYMDYKLDFLSPAIDDSVSKHFTAEALRLSKTFLHISRYDPKISVLWGHAYEAAFFSHLNGLQGKTFCLPLQPLKNNQPADSSTKLPHLVVQVDQVMYIQSKAVLNKEAQMANSKGKVIYIGIVNFETIDGLILDGTTLYGIQVTKKNTHSVAEGGLIKMNEWKKNGKFKKVILVFVHPEDVPFTVSVAAGALLEEHGIDAYHAVWDPAPM